ncbi:hypothetical protein [Bradyrhizobium sp. 21]|uniref:hypothetical protein n=1 Tax=Bradyrhizobium sp. 21 TaxID=2782666 RepID=UPI001FFAF996|nr:hypothetical protein [Bradyrhizobium sp. 21]MCK1387670.1 hypothetical protein [Bradyrhizobium sp. 21]
MQSFVVYFQQVPAAEAAPDIGIAHMKTQSESKASNDSTEPSKILEALAFLIVICAGVALLAIFDIRIGDVSVVASKLALVLAFAIAWIAKAVRIAVTRVLLPFVLLFVVVVTTRLSVCSSGLSARS